MAAADQPKAHTSGKVSPIPSHHSLSAIKTSPHTSLSLVNHSTLPRASSGNVRARSAELPHSDSAQSLLRDVQTESENERSGGRRGVFGRRSRGSGSKEGAGREVRISGGSEVRDPRSKHYAKMGLVMGSPTKQVMSHWPRPTSSSVDISKGVANEDVAGEVLRKGSGGSDIQSSPPISVKNESLPDSFPGEREVPTSSPDSGYGNTPDNPGGPPAGVGAGQGEEPTGSLLLGPPRARSGAINQNQRSDTQDSAYGTEPSRGTTPTTSLLLPAADGLSHDSGRVSTSLSSDSREMERQLQQGLMTRTHSQAMSPPSSLPATSTTSPSSGTRQPIRTQTSPHTRRRRFRTTSSNRSLSKSTEMTGNSRSFTRSPQPRDEKDYFQVTDELSQEHSHFNLSEALLAVIEQYKATRLEQQLLEDQYPLPSTPLAATPTGYMPAGFTPPSPYSTPDSSSYLSSWASMSSIATNPEDPDGRGSEMTRVSLLELMQSQPSDHSAESTAQKLLQHMAGHMTGGMRDISQLSLKLPTDFLISLQTDEDLQRSVTTSSAHMRGSRDWAPPRKQIIYHIKQPTKNMQTELAAQGHRCTGCGMKVDSAHSKLFRFCNYVGKYFCQNCHTNATHIIPAHILERWSFKKLPVSNFARDLLTKFQNEPVFSVNPSQHPVYKKVQVMGQVKEVRAQLVAIRQYLRTCRNGTRLSQMLEATSPWTTDLSSFSLNDFLELKAGTKLKQLKSLLMEAIGHVKSCPICQGRGFVCEFCKNSNDIIFPFEASKVSVCRDCRCCFHKDCFADSTPCPRCERMKERQKQRVSRIVSEEVMEDEEFGEDPSAGEPPR